jgi:hypothetical protein
MASPDRSPIVNFQVVNDWGSGFQAGVDVATSQNVAIADWTLEFDFGRSITQIWNASILNRVGTRYTIRNGGWNANLDAGAKATFGFTATPGGTVAPPSNYVLSWGAGGGGGGGGGGTLPTLTLGDARVTEGNAGATTASFVATLSAAATAPVTVGFATADGTARAGADYTATTGTLTFAPGETRKTIAVAVAGDTATEPDETFSVLLSNAVGATVVDGQGLGTITDDDAAPPPTTRFNYGEALQKALFFYEAGRSGDLPEDYIVDWRGDSAMSDGKDVGVDLTGGYYDAGDHVKFGLPMAYSMSMLAWGVVQYRDAYARSGQLARMLDAIKWGTDYIVKAHTAPNEFWGQVGRGDLDHAAWVAPEVMTMARPAFKIDASRPGSDLAGQAAAALASAAIAFRPTDPAYADLLIRHAQELFNFGDTYRGKYSDSIPDAANYYTSRSYLDDLAWGALWLHRATGSQAYLDKARTIYDGAYGGQTMTWTQSWDDVRYGSAVLLAGLTGEAKYRADAERWLDYWTVGINGGSTRVSYTPGGLAFLNGWGSLRYASTTAFVALVYADTVRDFAGRYQNFALRQINYILGDNPRQSSYVVGFGNNFPQNPHHRGGSGVWDGNVANPTPNRHVLYGALVGGPESASDANYHDDRTNYISNEVALDYNAGFTGALARLYGTFGGAPLARFPIPEARDPEYFVQARLNNQGATFTEVDAQLNNRSAWPARISSGLSFRYFVDLSETFAAGFSAADVQVQSNYSQGATVGPLLPWDAARRLYYVDVSFAGVPIGPGAGTFQKAAQIRVGLRSGVPAAAWDPTNDPSYQGLAPAGTPHATTVRIPVYEAGRRLFGQEPGASLPGTPTLSVDDLSLVEGNGGTKAATFTVRLAQPAAGVVTVNYGTADGTATAAGGDYAATRGTLTFPAGTTAQAVTVPVLGDALAEANETFRLVLSGAVGAVLARDAGVATIVDDDAPTVVATPVTLAVRDRWSTGFVADVTVRNTGTTAIDGWTLEFDLDADLTGIWSAEVVRRVGNRYTIRAASWNRRIAPGASVTFGFQGVPRATLLALRNVTLNGVPV